MQLKAYPQYQDSGLPWLGQIPHHWQLKPHRAIFEEIIDRKHIEEPMLSVTIGRGIIQQKSLLENSSKKDSSNQNKTAYKLVCPGDIAYNKMRAWQGAVGVSDFRGIVSPAYVVMRLREENNPNYFHYLFRTPHFAKEAERWSYGITSDQWSLRSEDFKKIYSPLPPRDEQDLIVRFLRVQDARFSRLIGVKRAMMALLNEQKSALIHRAVTRGVAGDVELKNSGLPWLGQVPKHWEVRRLKTLVENVTEQTSVKRPDEIYVAMEHVESWSGRLTIPQEEIPFESQVKRFQAGDILFGKLRPYLAKIIRPEVNGVCVGEFLVLRTKEKNVLPQFVELKLRSKQIIDLINTSTAGARMPRADWSFIGSIAFAFPPISEQRAIVSYIESETAQINAALGRIGREIELIAEYRTRLVCDVVTGQWDVRDIAATSPDIVEAPALDVDLDDENDENITAEED